MKKKKISNRKEPQIVLIQIDLMYSLQFLLNIKSVRENNIEMQICLKDSLYFYKEKALQLKSVLQLQN